MSLKDLCAQYKNNYNGELDCSELIQLFDYVQVKWDILPILINKAIVLSWGGADAIFSLNT